MRISAALPSGVTALLFEAAAARRALEGRLVPALEQAGFSEALLPILDYAAPYEPLLTPRRRGELYRFVDRGGELLALRADFTPLLARLLAPRLESLPAAALPLRLFYRGDVVRYGAERPGRMREFYQLGAERIGGDGPAAEREILSLCLDLLVASGASPVRVVLGFAGALDGLLLRSAGDPLALAAAIERRERSAAGAERDASLLAIVTRGVPPDPADLGDRADELRATLALGEAMRRRTPDIAIDVDLAEFAGHVVEPSLRARSTASGDPDARSSASVDLDARSSASADLDARSSASAYYDGLMFRAYVGTDTVPVGSGGRYDGLFRSLGSDVAAAGFSLGVDRLLAPDAAAEGGA